MSTLLKDKNGFYDEESDTYYGDCDLKKYDSVYLAIGDHFYEIPPSKYVYVDDESDYNACGINFGQNLDESWLLGDLFMSNYYTIHDDEKNRVSIVPHKNSKASVFSFDIMPLP